MLRRVNFYSICIAFGLSVLLILAGSRYTDNTIYRPSPERIKDVKNFVRVEDGEENLSQPIPTNSYDGSPDIEQILDKTRTKIRSELNNYNFTVSGVRSVDDLLVESGGQPVRTLIVSTWRSGTTFLGEIINSIPGTFYHYEPLLKYDIIQIRGPPYAENALLIIKKMFKCNYDDMEDYFKYGRTHLHQFSHNTRLWDHCKYKKGLCFDAEFSTKFCQLFPFHIMKIVRVRLRLIEEILQDKELKVKVILLVRDPRGVMQSRHHRNFCQPAPDCWNPELLCADMISDYVAAGRLLQDYPDRLIVLRYEDLALNPNTTTHKLFKFLELDVAPSVNEFLHSHTNLEVAGVSSTFRVSKYVPFRWKNILNFTYVEEVQMKCKEAMGLWGYNMAQNLSHMTSNDFNPVGQYSLTQ